MRKIKGLRKNEKGFTLIELIIVIAILAIIAAVAVPNIINSVSKARISTDQANAKMILNAAVKAQSIDEKTAVSIADLSAAAAADSYHEAVMNNLNGELPELQIDSAATIAIVVDGDGNISVTFGGTEMAPTAADTYAAAP